MERNTSAKMSTDESLDERPLLPPAPPIAAHDGKVTILAKGYQRIYDMACKSARAQALAEEALSLGLMACDIKSRREHRRVYRRIRELQEELEQL